MTRTTHQSGFTIIEIVAAIALLTICIVGFARLAAFTSLQRNAEANRQAAADQLQNVFEQLADQPADKLIALDFDQAEYESTSGRTVRGGTIAFSCEPATFENDVQADSVQSYLFRATLTWSRDSNLPGKVSLFRLLTADPIEPKGEPEQ